eukprot:199319-Prorocentrum_minimum.AAC.1
MCPHLRVGRRCTRGSGSPVGRRGTRTTKTRTGGPTGGGATRGTWTTWRGQIPRTTTTTFMNFKNPPGNGHESETYYGQGLDEDESEE